MLRNPVFKVIVCASLFILIVLGIWTVKSWSYSDKQKLEISKVLGNVVREQASKNMLLPHIVFINTDSIDKAQIRNTLIKQVTLALTDKYLRNDTTKLASLDIAPLVSSPILRDANGKYFISESQAEGFKSSLDFLIRQTDAQVSSVKEEIGRDIDRLNLWVTIWIGFLSIVGIFIPLVINWDASKKIAKAREQAETAKTTATIAKESADAAIQILNDAKPQIEKIAGIEKSLGDAEHKVAEMNITVSAVGDMATTAIQKANTVHLVHSIDRLELVNLRNFKNTEKEDLYNYLIVVLKRVHQDLNDCNLYFTNEVVKESVSELAWRLQEITYLKLIDAYATADIMKFVQIIAELIKKYNGENFKLVINGLETLFTSIQSRHAIKI